MVEANSSGDSSDLEALFDSISKECAQVSLEVPAVVAPPVDTPATPSLMKQAVESDGVTDDSDDLQALFDSISASKQEETAKAQKNNENNADAVEGAWQDKVFQQVGLMTRQLHDTLGSLGYDKLLEKTVSTLPDTKDRLAYIANLTEQAACKVLNATDIANPLQDELEVGASLLATKWDALFANKMGVEDFKLLASETRSYLKSAVPQRTAATKEQLLEIMMAQDFQDLTGQVIKKVISVAQEMEAQLMGVLIDTMPVEKRNDNVNSLLNGPVINAAGRTDVVGTQQQVDDLLDSLGF